MQSPHVCYFQQKKIIFSLCRHTVPSMILSGASINKEWQASKVDRDTERRKVFWNQTKLTQFNPKISLKPWFAHVKYSPKMIIRHLVWQRKLKISAQCHYHNSKVNKAHRYTFPFVSVTVSFVYKSHGLKHETWPSLHNGCACHHT